MSLRLFDDNVKKSATVDFWIENAKKYWPTRALLTKAEAAARVDLRRGKGNRETVIAKIKAIQHILKNEKTV